MAPIIDTLFKDGIIEKGEARLRIGFPEDSPAEDGKEGKAPQLLRKAEGSRSSVPGKRWIIAEDNRNG
jgi:hypothetical protein